MTNSSVIDLVEPSDILSAQHDPEALAVFDFLARYRNPKTRESYAHDLKVYLRFCRERHLGMLTVTRGDLERFIAQLEARDLAQSTVAGCFSTVFLFLEFAEIDDRIPKNPARKVQRPKIDHDAQRRPYFEMGELHAIVSQARRYMRKCEDELTYVMRPQSECWEHRRDEVRRRFEHARRDYALLQLMSSTGMRVGSVCSLDIGSLHFAAGTAYLEYVRKGGRNTRDSLPLETLMLLRAYIDSRTTGPLFLNNYEHRITRHNVASIIDRVAHEVGIERHVPPHGVRRSFYTIAKQLGATQSELQDSMHHVDPRTGTTCYDMHKDAGGAAARLRVAELISA